MPIIRASKWKKKHYSFIIKLGKKAGSTTVMAPGCGWIAKTKGWALYREGTYRILWLHLQTWQWYYCDGPDCGQVVMVAMTSVIREIFFLADNYSLAYFISSYRKAIIACVKRKIYTFRRN